MVSRDLLLNDDEVRRFRRFSFTLFSAPFRSGLDKLI